MILSGGRDLMGPLDSLDGYCSSLAVIGYCSLRVTGPLRLSPCVLVFERIFCVSVSTSVASIDLMGLLCGSYYVSDY